MIAGPANIKSSGFSTVQVSRLPAYVHILARATLLPFLSKSTFIRNSLVRWYLIAGAKIHPLPSLDIGTGCHYLLLIRPLSLCKCLFHEFTSKKACAYFLLRYMMVCVKYSKIWDWCRRCRCRLLLSFLLLVGLFSGTALLLRLLWHKLSG